MRVVRARAGGGGFSRDRRGRLPICQLVGFPACRFVGKSESWRLGGVVRGVSAGWWWFTGGVRRAQGEIRRRAQSGYRVIAGCSDCRVQSVRAEGLVVYPRVRERNGAGGFSRARRWSPPLVRDGEREQCCGAAEGGVLVLVAGAGCCDCIVQ